jgi:hypothetical protein
MPQVVDRIMGTPDTIGFKANGNQPSTFDKISTLVFLTLRLTGTLTLANYSVAPTKLVEAVENLISLILLTAVGQGAGTVSDPIKSVDFSWLRTHTQMMTLAIPTKVDIGTANAAYNFESNVTLYLGKLNMLKLSALNLQVTWRDAAAMVTGGTGGTATLSNVQVVVHGREILGDPNQANPSRAFIKESQTQFTVTQTAQDFALRDLPIGNVILRMGVKGTVGTADYADPSDTIFANTSRAEGPHVRIVENTMNTRLDMIYGAMRADNATKYGSALLPGVVVWQPRSPYVAVGARSLMGRVDTNYTGGSVNTIRVTTVEVVNKALRQ